MIRRIHTESRETYGAPRIHAELRAQGVRVGRKRVARLMRQAGLAGVSRRRKKGTTKRDPSAEPAPDLVERNFTASKPDELWVADITYIPTGEGFLYLAVVIDAFSRRVVGWAMRDRLKAELVLEALEMAIRGRRPRKVVHHQVHRLLGRFSPPHRKEGTVQVDGVVLPRKGVIPPLLDLLFHHLGEAGDALG